MRRRSFTFSFAAAVVCIALVAACELVRDTPSALISGGSSRALTGNLALGKPIAASSVNASYPATNANDGNVETYWEASGGVWPSTLTVDLGAGTSVGQITIKLNPATVWSTRTQTLSVLASQDNSSFVTIAPNAGYTFNPATGNSANIAFTSVSYRYFRLSFTGNTGAPGAQVAEYEIYGILPSPGPSVAPSPSPSVAPSVSPSPAPSTAPTNLAPGKTISASSFTQTYVAANANDGNTGTYWEGAANSWPNTLTVDLGASANVSKVVVKLNPAAVWSVRTQAFSILSSINNSSYTTILASANYSFDPAANANTATATFATTATRYVRINFTSNTGGSGAQAAEVEVWGSFVPVPSPSPSIAPSPSPSVAPSPSIAPSPSPGPAQSAYGGTNWPVANGAIIQAENYDIGGPGIAYNDTDAVNSGGQYRTDQVDVENSGDTGSGYNVGWIAAGEWLEYTTNVSAGSYDIVARVASGVASTGTLSYSLDGASLGTVNVPGTGGWQSYVDVTLSNVSLSGGNGKILRLSMGGGGNFNVNYIRFVVPTTPSPSPTPTPSPGSGDIIGHVFAGYQGWFTAAGDGSPVGQWIHWSKNASAPAPGSVNFEIYPDLREYPANKLYQTGLANLGNGQPAKLFSSFDAETVNLHFQWMQSYGIDGVGLQRFGASESNSYDAWRANRDSVAVKVKNAAEATGRKFYVMYDITGMNASTWVAALQNDWTNNVVGTMHLTSSPAYAKQNGKIVVCVWGIGFNDRPGDFNQCMTIINWFKNQGIYIIGGVPTYWRQGINDSRPGFTDVYKALNMISPWLVGRFSGIAGADDFKNNLVAPDYSLTQTMGVDYQPVLWPGFSWVNLNNGPPNQIPRLNGDFMWRQAYNVKSAGISTGYVAMFDEYDEGTAIAKASENASMAPTNNYFLNLDADGASISSDYYLRLTGDINRMFKGQIGATATRPTSFR